MIQLRRDLHLRPFEGKDRPGTWVGMLRDGVASALVACPFCGATCTCVVENENGEMRFACPRLGCTFDDDICLEGWGTAKRLELQRREEDEMRSKQEAKRTKQEKRERKKRRAKEQAASPKQRPKSGLAKDVMDEGQLAELFLWRMEKASKRILRDLFKITRKNYRRKEGGTGVVTTGTTEQGSKVTIDWSADEQRVGCSITMVQTTGNKVNFSVAFLREWFEQQRPNDVKDAVVKSFLRTAMEQKVKRQMAKVIGKKEEPN